MAEVVRPPGQGPVDALDEHLRQRPHYAGPAATVRVIAAGGMAGWQVALIAARAALAAAAAAVLADRPPQRHRHHRLMRPPQPHTTLA